MTAELERRYRSLLRMYPRGYRRTHGEEILATLMDGADPARTRPARADVIDLVRGALRQRFRLPVGVLPKVAAGLTALALAAFAAAGSSWLIWHVAARDATDAAAAGTGAVVTGTTMTASSLDRYDGPKEVWPRILVFYRPRISGWTAAGAQERLRAQGWTPGATRVTDRSYDDAGVHHGQLVQEFEATRDGVVVSVNARTFTTPGEAGSVILIRLSPDTPPGAAAFIALGALGGGVLGWLLVARVSYLLRRRSLPRRFAAATLATGAAVVAAGPVLAIGQTLGRTTFSAVGRYEVAPLHQWLVQNPTAWQVIAALLAGAAVVMLAGTDSGEAQPSSVSVV